MANASADTIRQRFAILQQTLVARARPGIFFYPTSPALYLPLVAHDAIGIGVTLATMFLLGLLSVARVVFYRSTAGDPEQWRRRFTFLAMGSITVFESLVAFEGYRRSLDPSILALVATSVTLRASATFVSCPDLRIHDAFERWTRLPIAISLLVIGTPLSLMLLALTIVHMLYIHRQSRTLNAEFWAAIHDREERERVEMELRLAQKLESVGRLAAGIAHEINTPLQAMMGNLEFMREGVDELLAMANPKPEEVSELAYLRENLPESFTVTQECLERTAAIVRSVKKFAHPELSKRSLLDINAALQSTLDIARHEYAMVADAKTDFGAVPPIECFAGELNQALLNIVINAAHAMEDVFAKTNTRGTLWVRTRVDDGCALIEIEDTGGGIPDAIRDRVFDPFFTTKDVGKGTGQGLAIARSVAVRHGGDLTFRTRHGHGTTFVIRLPLPMDAAIAA